MKIDVYWSQPHYADHLWPLAVWLRVLGFDPVQRPHASLARNPEHVEPLADDGTPTIVAGHGDLALVPASRPVALVSHGVDQTYRGVDHGAYAGGRDRDRVGLFVCPSHRSVEINARRYPTADYVAAGPLRLDSLLSRRPPRPGRRVVGLAWHHDSTIAPETRSAWPYYHAVLSRLTDRYDFVGHGHPRDHGEWPRRYQALGVRHEPDVDEFLTNIDLLAADNTSLLYETAALGVPTVTLDAPWYRPDVDHGLRFWDAVPGVRLPARIDSPSTGPVWRWGRDRLGDVLDAALDDPAEYATARARALHVAYGAPDGETTLLDGNAAKRAADAVVAWLT